MSVKSNRLTSQINGRSLQPGSHTQTDEGKCAPVDLAHRMGGRGGGFVGLCVRAYALLASDVNPLEGRGGRGVGRKGGWRCKKSVSASAAKSRVPPCLRIHIHRIHMIQSWALSVFFNFLNNKK